MQDRDQWLRDFQAEQAARARKEIFHPANGQVTCAEQLIARAEEIAKSHYGARDPAAYYAAMTGALEVTVAMLCEELHRAQHQPGMFRASTARWRDNARRASEAGRAAR